MKDYVVYVTFPANGGYGLGKQYCYLCNISPRVKVGDIVIANNTKVRVERVAEWDSIATRYASAVPSQKEVVAKQRKVEIITRLTAIEKEEADAARWAKLKSAEAKALVRELRRLK